MTRRRRPARHDHDRRRGARGGRTPSLTLLSLRGELTAYLTGELLDEEIPAVVQKLVGLVRRAEQEAGLGDLGAWHRSQVDAVLDGPPGSIDQAEDEAALAVLFGFLSASGRWTGDREVLLDVLSAASRAMAAQLRAVAADHHDAGREAAAVAASDVVRTTTAFLDWFGAGPRALTATAALRRDDVHDAIDQLALPAQPRRVTSMWDHPDLVSLWSRCLGAGLLVVDGSRARVTAMGDSLRLGDPSASGELLRWAIASELCDPEHGYFPDGVPLGQVAEMTLAAMQGDGPHVPDEPQGLDIRALRMLEEPDSVDPDEEAVVVSSLYFSTLLASGGWLVVGGRLAVVPGLESLVLTTVADLQDRVMIAPGATQLGSARARGDDLWEVSGVAAGATVRLRVSRDDDRGSSHLLELPADATLADLHHALRGSTAQSAGDRHEFLGLDPVGRRTRWTPGAIDDAEDENGAPLLDVLARVAVLGYLLGDDEDGLHRVTLESVRSSPDGR